MVKRNVAIFGLGGIGRSLVESWQTRPPMADLICVCGRPKQIESVRGYVGEETTLATTIADMLKSAPDIVVEAVGHAGALEAAELVLEQGADLFLLSVGILADTNVRNRLIEVARANGTAIVIPAGALAGFDGLLAIARLPGTTVKYTSIKPSYAWKGTPAEQTLDLDQLTEPTTFFRGSAQVAAQLYPKNANLAAAVALAGVGFDETQVELVADPISAINRGIVEATNAISSLKLEVSGPAIGDNPKTSAIVPESVLSAIDGAQNILQFA